MNGSKKLILFLIVFIDLLAFGILIPMLPFYARSFGASATEVSLLMFVFSGSQIFVSPLWGAASDRFGRRPILLITILGQAGAMLWGGFAQSFTVLLWSRILAGVFSANISTAQAYMADITKPEERAKGLGLIGMAFGLGFIFGPAVGAILVQRGLQWPSLFGAAIASINFVLALIILSESIEDPKERAKNRRRFSWGDYKATFRRADFRTPFILFFLSTLAFVQMEISFGLFMADRFGFTPAKVGYALASMGFLMALVQGGAIGSLVKKFGEWKLIRVALPMAGLGLLILSYSGTLTMVGLGLFLLGLGYSLNNPCLSAVVSRSANTDTQGRVLGIYQSFGSMARVIGPLLAGWLYDQYITAAFMAGAVALLFGSIVAMRSRNLLGT